MIGSNLRVIKCTEERSPPPSLWPSRQPSRRHLQHHRRHRAQSQLGLINLEFGGHGVGHIMHGDPHVPNISTAPTTATSCAKAWSNHGSSRPPTRFQDPKDGWTLRASDLARHAHSSTPSPSEHDRSSSPIAPTSDWRVAYGGSDWPWRRSASHQPSICSRFFREFEITTEVRFACVGALRHSFDHCRR